MTLSDIQTQITFYTGADTTQYPNANRLININNAIYEIETLILRSSDSWDFDDTNKADFPILTTNVVANQQDYQLPTGTYQVKRLEISYDGSTWVEANPIDISQISGQTENTTDFSTATPYYDLSSGSLFLYPKPTANVTAGLKIWISRAQTAFSSSDLTTGTATPGFDINFHDLVAKKAGYIWNLVKKRDNSLLPEIQKDEASLASFYGQKQKDGHITMTASYTNYN